MDFAEPAPRRWATPPPAACAGCETHRRPSPTSRGKVTMQNLYHDGGYSSMGMSRRAMKLYEKGLEVEYQDIKNKI